jgi:hypothetical protein
MKGEVRVLAARRFYEFTGDAIQVAAFALSDVQQPFRSAFEFQTPPLQGAVAQGGAIQVGVPAFTFQSGRFSTKAGPIPIRYISFEPSRLTIDIIGPTAAIEALYQMIREVLKPLKVGGSPVIAADAARFEDVSELTVQLDIDLVKLIDPRAYEIAENRLPRGSGQSLAMTLRLEIVNPDEAYPGGGGVAQQHLLQVRAGTRPADRVVFTLAPLGTEAHINYLRDLERAVLGAELKRSRPLVGPGRRRLRKSTSK